MNINLHIERLVLDGLVLGPEQGAKVKAAVEVELSRMLQEGGIAPGIQKGEELPSIRTKPLQVSGKASPHTLGSQIAQAVYGGIGK
ncbi:hypothetical protein [uncultured Desulfobacter sp.]|uniref:hypothetical protein n=1 Tax=uncultured Desulfobacter sp. TaxID=240139 RepID=UPI002AA9315E|nr:hypothetical protein [uncultured Desulfobacter sp.]